MWSAFRRFGFQALICFATVGAGTGCAKQQSGTPAAHPAPVHVTPPVLSDAQFTPVVRDLLLDGEPTPQRTTHIASAIHHLLARSRGYFEEGLDQQGLDTATGAMLLARSGELHPKSLTGYSGVLVSAADEAARRGDEGRARAFYELAELAADPAHAEAARKAREHLKAIERWEAETQDDGSMQAIASRRLSAVKRALIRRETSVVNQAERAIMVWVERAIEINRADAPIESLFDHDERIAARLAFLTGAQTMIALYLRDGNAAAALGALDSDVTAAITEPRWVTGLISASEGNSQAWFDWYRLYQSAIEQPEFFDLELARAAQWGISVELMRSDGAGISAMLPLLSQLNHFGMPDVAPALLASRAKPGEKLATEEQQARQVALGMVFESLLVLTKRNDVELARVVFSNAEPVLRAWGTPAKGVAAKPPTAVDFYETMGALEVHNGNLDRALPLLSYANKNRPSVDNTRLLAAIERQQGRLQVALDYSGRMTQLAREQQLPVAETQGALLSYDLLLETGREQEANGVLSSLLKQLLAWRQKPATPRFAAAIERNLAQVFERYGELDAARRANERARAASLSDEDQLSDVLLDEARRSLTFGEVSHGRLALRHAIEGNIDNAALVYAALWQHLLELRLKAPSDGTVEQALGRVLSESGWVGTLAEWGAGRLNDEGLLARAKPGVEQVEARFYVAMKQFVVGPSGARAQLVTVAQSPAIELIEVRIARDLTSKSAATGVTPPLPDGIVLP